MSEIAKIIAEIQRAVVRLGGDLKTFPEVATPAACVTLLEQLHADRELLGVVGSWQGAGRQRGPRLAEEAECRPASP